MAVEKYILYHYNPSFVAAVIFIALFGLATSVHFFQLLRKRTWYFIPFLIGGLFETIGYVGRAISSKQSPDWTTTPYVMQSLLLLLAPALFAASIYMILGRIIRLTDGEAHSPIRVNWLTKIFVAGDVISFLMQCAGGGILAQAKKQSQVTLGERIITAGLIVQVTFFGLFFMAATLFHKRMRKAPTQQSQMISVPWKRHLMVLYAASACILIRSDFRIIEYMMGQDGPLLSTEVYLYVFDAALMFIMMVLLSIWHPDFSKEDMRIGSSHSELNETRSRDVEPGVEYSYVLQERPKP